MAESKDTKVAPESVTTKVTQTQKETPTTVEATKVKSTETNYAPPAPAPEAKKGGFSFGKCCLFGCIALLLCCICTIVFALVAPNLLVKTITGGNRAPDATLTRLTGLTEFKQLETLQVYGLESFITANEYTGEGEILIGEKDIEVFILNLLGVKSADNTADETNVKKVGVQLTPGMAKMEIDLGIVANMLKSSDMQNFDPKIFDGINFSFTLRTSADNKTFILDNFSTGNSVIDSLIPAQLKESLIASIQENIESSLMDSQGAEMQLKRIEFRQGQLFIQFTTSTIPTAPY